MAPDTEFLIDMPEVGFTVSDGQMELSGDLPVGLSGSVRTPNRHGEEDEATPGKAIKQHKRRSCEVVRWGEVRQSLHPPRSRSPGCRVGGLRVVQVELMGRGHVRVPADAGDAGVAAGMLQHRHHRVPEGRPWTVAAIAAAAGESSSNNSRRASA